MDNNSKVLTTLKRNGPPAHYLLKIDSFSQLLEFLSRTGSENYESREFEVAGYKWKLSLFPNGDKKRNGNGHISLYLVLCGAENIPLGNEVDAFFQLFAYDQIRNKYMTVQDASKTDVRFHAMKTEDGVSQFIPLATFNDATNGYLVNDLCAFGVEVFLTKSTGNEETIFPPVKPQKTITYTMGNFSKLKDNKEYRSSTVNIAGYKWCIGVYLHGMGQFAGYLPVFLEFDADYLRPDEKVWAEFTLRVKNQVRGRDREYKDAYWFNKWNKTWGFPDMILLSELKDESKGYLKNDSIIVELEITQVKSVKDSS